LKRAQQLAMPQQTQYLRSNKLFKLDIVTVCLATVVQQDRHNVLYIQRKNEARSCNHCCSRRAESITYSECMLVALGIYHSPSMPFYIVICGL